MKKTLQDQYLLIKEGKGHKGVFLTEAKRQFPDLIPNNADVKLTAQILKDKNIINENIVGLDAVGIFTPTPKQSYETAFEKFLQEAKEMEEKEKAELKKPSKQVEEDLSKAYDNTDEKNIDNVIFDQVMTGYYAELKDPKNADKTMEELKAIVLKNLAKDPIHYTKDGQFGIKGLGYETEHPGLGTPKEAKGKYASSGYGNLNENKQPMSINESKLRNAIRAIIREELNSTKPLNEDYDLVSQFKGDHHGSRIEKNKYLNSLGLDEDGIKTLEIWINTMKNDKNWFNQKYPNGGSYVDLISYISKKVKDLPSFVMKNKSVNPIKVVNSLKEINEDTLNENVHKRLKEIDTEVQDEVTQSKLSKIIQEIEKRQAQLKMIDENEDLRELTDKSKVKALQKEIKLLEKAQAKLEKAGKGKKKEVLDEADEPSQEYLDAKSDAEARYNEGEDIESIMSDYPQFKNELYQDIIGGFEGSDY
jgi:hypothetical protein